VDERDAQAADRSVHQKKEKHAEKERKQLTAARTAEGHLALAAWPDLLMWLKRIEWRHKTMNKKMTRNLIGNDSLHRDPERALTRSRRTCSMYAKQFNRCE
jgi:hypothetical protein